MENSAYVYIYLGEGFVPAGRLHVEQTGSLVRARFAYGKQYLARPDAVALDPFQLPLVEGWVESEGLHFAFEDVSPDNWGRHLLERAAEENELAPSEFDYLTVLDQENRIGALAFGSDLSGPSPFQPHWRPETIPNNGLDLAEMIKAADAVLAHEDLEPKFRRFLIRGSSLGGAQPKAPVDFEGRRYIAKFSRQKEAWPTCRIEFAAMSLAKICGIRTAECRRIDVGGRDVLLVERFDRGPGATRKHFLSARTFTQSRKADEGSYEKIAYSMQRVAAIQFLRQDLEELFRRMVFNILINNHDDHLCNHGFLYDANVRGWRLSPAYDIVPQPMISGDGQRYLTLRIGTQGRLATLANALSRCDAYRLSPTAASKIVEEMRAQVGAQWEDINRYAGVPETKLASLREAYATALES